MISRGISDSGIFAVASVLASWLLRGRREGAICRTPRKHFYYDDRAVLRMGHGYGGGGRSDEDEGDEEEGDEDEGEDDAP
jgi:hypothetical protein